MSGDQIVIRGCQTQKAQRRIRCICAAALEDQPIVRRNHSAGIELANDIGATAGAPNDLQALGKRRGSALIHSEHVRPDAALDYGFRLSKQKALRKPAVPDRNRAAVDGLERENLGHEAARWAEYRAPCLVIYLRPAGQWLQVVAILSELFGQRPPIVRKSAAQVDQLER